MGDRVETSKVADDEESLAVLRTIGRFIKAFRERSGLTQAELGKAVGYSEEQVSSIERGRRAPSVKFLIEADRVLGADGLIARLQEDVEQVEYPQTLRHLTRFEADAVESYAYTNSVVHGLLQTPEYTRALYAMRRPPFTEEEMKRLVAARLARQKMFDRQPEPVFSFIQDEVTLRRPLGGRAVMRTQLEHLLEMGERRNVDIQVMPMDVEEHASIAGAIRLLRLTGGATVAFQELPVIGRIFTQPKKVRPLEIRYGNVRAQALAPRDSLAFIEQLLGET
ncbi:Scr1 family TA system antitoxin-like transcriptional regulator [Streptomyces sp. NPDC056716]|uniref:helix-turn-helix domain-containing protein n=1 Tax=unclassified Streptomyces TaxID=2593676 RepID=UPI00369A0948